MTATAQETCGGHAGVGEELRALVLAALDRVGPVLDRIRDAPPGRPATSATTCTVCPVCAVIAALRGERPELAVRLAEHAAELLAALRAALEEGGPAAEHHPENQAPEPAPTSTEPPTARRVQRIRVDRPGRC